MKNIKHFAFSDSLTVFWEKDPSDRCLYRLVLTDGKEAVTDKTHYTFTGLQADTEYGVQVFGADQSMQLEVKTLRRKEYLNVTKAPYLAVGDGKTVNTAVLQQAIDDCGADQAVYFPAVFFLTGALKLHGNMEIYIDKGGVLQGTEEAADYEPKIKSRFEGHHMDCYQSLLNIGELDYTKGPTTEQIILRGEGTICGGGRLLAENIMEIERIRLHEYMDRLGEELKEYENENTIPGRARGRLINISNTRNVIISGLTLKNGPSWNVHMIYSDQVITHNCFFQSRNIWNGDGWDPDSSTNCTIFGCHFQTGDDAIAIKSGKNPEGNIVNRPSKTIRIFDCVSEFGHGFTIGSEMSGGIEDVAVWDCDLSGSKYGLEIKGTKKRGGYVRDIRVENCTVPRIMMHSVGYNDDGESAGQAPYFEGCRFENLTILGSYQQDDGGRIPCNSLELIGFDETGHELNDLIFRNITIGSEEGLKLLLHHCGKIVFEQIGTSRSIEKILL